jgi:arsenical resistance protein ArsH
MRIGILVTASCIRFLLCHVASAKSPSPSNPDHKITMSLPTESAIWDGSDVESYHSTDHPGYSLESDPTTHVGGWHAHRAAWAEAPLTSADDSEAHSCWIKDEVMELITKFDYNSMPIGRSPKILVLYGSLRPTSFSRKLAYEFARLLDLLGCDVRVYNPRGLPVRDPALENELKVKELRALTQWSDGHMWVSPEMHGTITGVFKNQIDWIPLNTGSVRPTQGKTCCVAQVNGGSQSFNAVNFLRLLARWMRMPCCTNQSSVAKAWQEFDEKGRMKPSDFRNRVVDVAEEFAKFTAVMAPVADDLTNRYSERKEKMEKGRLLTQAEKEKEKTIAESRKG